MSWLVRSLPLLLFVLIAGCGDGVRVGLNVNSDFATIASGAPIATSPAPAREKQDPPAPAPTPVYQLADVLAYISANALYDPQQVHQGALAAKLSAAQLDALYGLAPGTAVGYITRQGWAPLPGGAVIEGLALPAPTYTLASVQQLIADANLQDPLRVYQYAQGAQLDALQLDALYGLPPGTAANFIELQGWASLSGGAVITGLVLPLADISVVDLSYSRTATFTLHGNNLQALALSIDLERCTGAAIVPGGTATQLSFTCRIAGTGPMTVRIRNHNGTLLLARTFEVPEPRVTLDTTMGRIVFELDPTRAPVTVNNFLAYVNDGFYPGTLFHRVISGFVVQGGGFTSGLVQKPPTYAPIVLESNNGLSNLRGTIAMARTPVADSATSQFYVNHVNNFALNYQSAASPGYAVFGRVVEGLSVVDAIAAVPTSTQNGLANVPQTPIVINGAQQTR